MQTAKTIGKIVGVGFLLLCVAISFFAGFEDGSHFNHGSTSWRMCLIILTVAVLYLVWKIGTFLDRLILAIEKKLGQRDET